MQKIDNFESLRQNIESQKLNAGSTNVLGSNLTGGALNKALPAWYLFSVTHQAWLGYKKKTINIIAFFHDSCVLNNVPHKGASRREKKLKFGKVSQMLNREKMKLQINSAPLRGRTRISSQQKKKKTKKQKVETGLALRLKISWSSSQKRDPGFVFRFNFLLAQFCGQFD